MLAIFPSITLPHHTPCKGSIISLHLMKSMESYIMIRMHAQCSLTTCTFLARDLSHPSAKEPSMHALIPCCPDGLCDVYWHRSMAKSKWCGDTHKWAVSSYVIRRKKTVATYSHLSPWYKPQKYISMNQKRSHEGPNLLFVFVSQWRIVQANWTCQHVHKSQRQQSNKNKFDPHQY